MATALMLGAQAQVTEANAGLVLTVTEDFIDRGTNELLSEFIDKMNLVGEQATYEINLGDYIESYKAED